MRARIRLKYAAKPSHMFTRLGLSVIPMIYEREEFHGAGGHEAGPARLPLRRHSRLPAAEVV